MRNNKQGFTLIELLVVVLIIGILSAVALPQYQKTVYKSKILKGLPLARAIKEAQDAYFLANGKWATSFEDLDIALPTNCTTFLGEQKQKICNGLVYGLGQNGDFTTSAFTSGYVTLRVFGCPGAGGSCVSLKFPYNHSYANWVYQRTSRPSCTAGCYWAGKKCSLEYGRQLCQALAGGNPPIYEDEYPL